VNLLARFSGIDAESRGKRLRSSLEYYPRTRRWSTASRALRDGPPRLCGFSLPQGSLL